MNNLFGFDSKLYKLGMVIGEMFILGVMWLIFSIPLITLGASTTALYYVATKKASGKDDYIWKPFMKAFKENFAKSTSVYLVLVATGFFIWTNLHILGQIELGWLGTLASFALYFVLMQVGFIAIHVFCIMARFEMASVVAALRTALHMSYRHFKTTIGCGMLLVLVVIATLIFPALFVFNMGVYAYLSSFLFVRMFRRHYPEFDTKMVKDDSNGFNIPDEE